MLGTITEDELLAALDQQYEPVWAFPFGPINPITIASIRERRGD